jgi:undecaprenyl phosphate-alpha-L-ara4N flippase subunit ArnE
MNVNASQSTYFYLGLLLLVIIMHSSSQMLYKSGVHNVRFTDPINTLLLNAPVFFGYVISFAASLLYLRVIQEVPLTMAFPTTVLIQVFVILGAHFLFKEAITLNHFIGFALIFAGLYFIWK